MEKDPEVGQRKNGRTTKGNRKVLIGPEKGQNKLRESSDVGLKNKQEKSQE